MEEIQKQMDAMIEDIDAHKDIITATADVGKVPYFFQTQEGITFKTSDTLSRL